MRTFIMIAAAAATPLSTLAGVAYTSQNRYVSVTAGGSDQARPQGFEDFNASVYAYHAAYFPERVQLAEASQHSSMNQHGITASGLMTADTGGYAHGSTAASVCDITFTIDTPMAYALSGSWGHGYSTSPASSRVAFIDFSGPGTHQRFEYVRPDWLLLPTTYPVSAAGVLQPGEYRLNIFFDWINSRIALGPLRIDPGEPMTYDVTLALTEIPAPSSLALLVPAFAMLTRRRR